MVNIYLERGYLKTSWGVEDRSERLSSVEMIISGIMR